MNTDKLLKILGDSLRSGNIHTIEIFEFDNNFMAFLNNSGMITFETGYGNTIQAAINEALTKAQIIVKLDYPAYLKSKEWKAKADALKKATGGLCQQCGEGGRLHVHHLTYENIGDEKPGDLIVLCKKCHNNKHNLKEITHE
jgi:hypothetical protein